MSAKEQLERLVADLSEEDAALAIALLHASLPGYARRPDERRRLPGSLGAGDSGRSDNSERIDDILAEELGRQR